MKLGCYLLLASLALVSASKDLITDLKNIRTPAHGLAFIENVKKESSKEEQQVLASLMVERQAASPKAMKLFEEVLTRSKARRLEVDLEHCSGFTDSTSCTACAPCTWDDSWSRCQAPVCNDNKNEADCCANAKKAPIGCYWAADAGVATPAGEKAIGKCNDMTCEGIPDGVCDSSFSNKCEKAETLCGQFSGCAYGCMGCQDAAMTCEDSGGMCSCGSGDLGAVMGQLMGMMSCPMMECSSCLKDPDATTTLTLAEQKARRTPACDAKCSSVIHCDDEVECLMGSDSSSSSSSTTPTCPETVYTPLASCGTTIETTTGAPSAGATCGAQCADFEATCTKSCGAVSDCPEVSGAAAQGMASCMKFLLMLVSPLALGTKFY